MRVLIADDHPIVRLGLRELLTRNLPGTEVGEADSGNETLRMARQDEWDVIVLDISFSNGDDGPNGLEVLQALRDSGIDTPVLMLTMYSTDEYVIRALKTGASGYLRKGSAPSVLCEAVRRVHGGGVFIEPVLAERVAFGLTQSTLEPPHRRLSEREFDVMIRLASGESPTTIAAALDLSVKTISTYRARLLAKTGLKNNAELTRYALENDLVR